MSERLGARIVLLLGAVTSALLLGGCPGWPPVGTAGDGRTGLKRFANGAELLRYFRQQARARATRGTGLLLFAAAPAGTIGSSEAEPATDQQGAGSEPYSTTNIQEEGVDESDTFKSDGTNFYIAKGKSLRIVRATPLAEMEELGHVDFDDPIDSLYLFGPKVIVLGRRFASGSYAGGAELMIWPPYYRDAAVRVSEVDVSDPNAPLLGAQSELDGSLVSSRLTSGKLILVLTIVPPLPENPNLFTINSVSLEEVLPKLRTSAGQSDLVVPENWYRPETPDGYFTTAVVTLDAGNVETVLGGVAVVADAGTIYASTEAVYVASTEYDASNGYSERTAIHRFAFNEQGVAEYVASGAVPGTLLNQFSLGEYAGYLRVATHVESFGGPVAGIGVASAGGTASPAVPTAQPIVDMATPPFNAVYVLRQAAGDLEVAGKVENIAPGETLHSARFLGNHGFLVTYRKTDPLFVLDLTDPNNPLLVGELKIPGFSDYLHPLDDTHLIGVGKYTIPTDQGFDWFQGVQVSLFDVSDWSSPQVVQQITLGGRGSESEVERTHKAFTFLPESNLLALPMQLYTVEQLPWEYGDLEFDGVVAFRVDKDSGFTELGRLPNVGTEDLRDRYYSYTEWRRAAFIGEVLYAVTPAGVRAADLGNLAEASTLVLVPAEDETSAAGGVSEAMRASPAGS